MQIDAEQLDTTQYTPASIEKYEEVYGDDFVSPGGLEKARELTRRLALQAGEKVLDVGCGLGGSAFLMARDYDAVVEGIDLSNNMIDLAQRKLEQHRLGDRVTLLQGDCLSMTATAKYDAIYSRDVFLHIHDKTSLFTKLFSLLRNDGRLLFTDYCCGPKPWSAEFTAYVAQRQYDLHTVEAYRRIIEAAGFRDVHAEDCTEAFINIAQNDLQTIEAANLSVKDRDSLQADWRAKIERAQRGEQRWGLFEAKH